MILVTGATGNVGSNVVAQLAEAGEKVRVLTRDPARHSFPEHVEVVPGDLTRPETLSQALDGVERTFLFPVHAGLDAFLDAARLSDLQHIVLMSTAAVTYTMPTWIGEQHLSLERAVAASGLAWTFVRPGYFATNDLAWVPQLKAGDVVRGVYGNAGLTPIDPRDIAAVSVRALLDERVGESFLLTGPEPLTAIDRVRIIAETIGRPLRFEELPHELYREQMLQHGMPAPVIDDMLEGLAALDGKTEPVLPTIEEVTGRPPFTYAQWVAHRAAAFGPAPVTPVH
ncbi:Uncharacterized conserved protein YbjT, contains NAD(P)-binding and DUF2867 domains [Nonomuraea solani]|uniref:Uncharacterized conserved protein YbjT, contains NAD(P)-binding and DUF2867 domains n=1 Tax=Nonomuraea solani TaxID=1144553 RepID=A0A1H6F2I4_9ACTN|nr:NAD(P)H-binding protein [Nonomuraea solani]SEH03164.1 Uncharacterized conserved protein YbjT, contains NAD(P)-binding and DUF2867 domains [Nonomuraea solani]